MPSPLLLTSAVPADRLVAQLEQAWREGRLVGLCSAQEQGLLSAAVAGSGTGVPSVVVGSGGSAGGRRWCLQPLAHLEASAAATGLWLQSIGLDPSATLQLDPLPLHHVSGLLPLVRSRLWGTPWRWLPPELMRKPTELAAAIPLPAASRALLSLVPTQLERLLAVPEGCAWLRRCALVWIGGGALSARLSERARAAEIPLAPCYGATETAAMVTALSPDRFLEGASGSGQALADVELRIDPGGALMVRTPRLSPGSFQAGRLQPLERRGSWWRSGDGARLGPAGLEILGRLDGAISSGGETVFPEQVEARLLGWARAEDLPLAHLLLLASPDPLWGQRLLALVRHAEADGADGPAIGSVDGLIARCRSLAQRLPPAQRPQHWLACPDLAPNALGKWERRRWRQWLHQSCDGGPRADDAAAEVG
ncbi:AMP-binding protein [Synechococcus sp. CS-205]|uniref:AMP-binding protein n=1 Tax=Synechococcus sp. CS-205 TaxID=2847984 RepID=UPI00223B77EC|nr:AMP-binding protein [Synechococcus sp. CS-205]MCT0247991.1 AMP-binding protein [Synechococcus sp. CS-205]